MRSGCMLPRVLLSLAVGILVASPSLAAITNRTIDDTRGDSVTSQRVSYLPTTGVWNSVSCPLCAIRPDPVQAYSGTWTEATYFKQTKDPISASFSFTGTAIYIYFIVANNFGSSTTKTVANIALDGGSPSVFRHDPDPSRLNDIQYNYLGFSRTNLANKDHSIVISVSGLQEEIYINFDYAIYTHEDIEATPVVPPTSNPTTTQNQQTPGTTAQSPTTTGPTSQAPTTTPGTTTRSSGSSAAVGTPGAATSLPPGASSTPNSSASAGGPQNTNSDAQTGGTVSNEKSSTPVGAIAGGVVGGLAVLALLLIGLIFIRRRGRGRNDDDAYDNRNKIEPYGSSEYGKRTPSPGPGHTRDPSNATSVNPFTLAPASTIQLSDTTAAASDYTANPYGGLAASEAGAGAGTQTVTSSKGRMEDLRRARQEELEQRLQATQQEMSEIRDEIERHGMGKPPRRRPLPGVPGQHTQNPSTLGAWGVGSLGSAEARYSAAPTEDQMTMDELKETLREMRAQMDYLQQQQQSAWAQGLSDEPPPGYSAIQRAFSLRRSQG